MLLNRGNLILAAGIIVLILTASTHVSAEGYNDPLQNTETPKGPHGGYTTTTNKCKDCHAVHLSTGSFKLTRSNSTSETCIFCHGGSGPGPTISLDDNGHGLSIAQKESTEVVAPDDTIPSYTVEPSSWGCDSCHSVHDNQTVKLADVGSTKLLKADPNPGKAYLYYSTSLIDPVTRETTQTVSQWCSTCHNANYGSHTNPKEVMINETTATVYGHDVSGMGYTTDTAGWANIDPDSDLFGGPKCKDCHVADGGSFPHSGSAPNMLKAGTDGTKLDNSCLSCHNTDLLP